MITLLLTSDEGHHDYRCPSSDVSKRIIIVIVKEIKRFELTFLNHLASYSQC